MPSSYPGALDSFTNPTGTDTQAEVDHAAQHANINDAVEAVQAELGINPANGYADVAAAIAAALAASDRRQLIPAAAMSPRAATDGPDVNGTTMSPNSAVIDQLYFDKDTQQYAAFATLVPSGCTKFKARFEWTTPVAGTGSVVFEAAGVFVGDGVSLGTAFGTAQTVTDAYQSTNLNHVSALTAAITPAGTAADGRTCLVQVSRNTVHGDDNFTQPAALNYVVLEWEP